MLHAGRHKIHPVGMPAFPAQWRTLISVCVLDMYAVSEHLDSLYIYIKDIKNAIPLKHHFISQSIYNGHIIRYSYDVTTNIDDTN